MARTAVLIGYLDQGNLALGYVAASLAQRGFAAQIIDVREEPATILRTVQHEDPALVGFSVIFQYYVPRFRELAAFLRDHGVTCHFTAGGHYPSLRHEEMLRYVPELDSVVRFEGEITAVELMECLVDGSDWRQLLGVAYRQGSKYLSTQPRPLVKDLDTLPYPARPRDGTLKVMGKKASPILASRGCSRACSFCSIRQFYGEAPGLKVRVRNPSAVVQEMKTLYNENGTSIFLFQDDDFPLWGSFGRRWCAEFTESIQRANLGKRILWKISCRCDEVEPALFTQLRDAGLYMVHLGIESGNEIGLRALNKKLAPNDGLRAVAMLLGLGIFFGYGFMLFDPSSTLGSVAENLKFLSKLTWNGSAPVVFCRMLAYSGTPIEDQLRRQGRMRSSVVNPDYDFVDDRVTRLFEIVNDRVGVWCRDPDSLAYQLNFAWMEYYVLRRLYPHLLELAQYQHLLRSITSEYNDYVLRLVEQACVLVETGEGGVPSLAETQMQGKRFLQRMIKQRETFVLRNQNALLTAMESESFHPMVPS